MIGLDSDILVRYLTGDDPSQSPVAAAVIESLTEARPGYVSVVAMAETVWVLESVFRWDSQGVVAALEHLFAISELRIEHETDVYAATTVARRRMGSFADALIGYLGLRAGCEHTVSFDLGAQRLPGFARP